MKEIVKTSILTATVVVALMFFGGCDKDTGTPSLVSGHFNGRISAEVDQEDWGDMSSIKYVVPWNAPEIDCAKGEVLGTQMFSEVSFSNNKFTIELKTPSSDIEMFDVQYVFENILDISGTLKYSDPDVLLADVDFLAYTTGLAGYFLNQTSDKKTECIYVYAESDVTVTGGSNISVKFEKGWNRLYFTEDGKNNKFTTKAPDGEMMWYYDNFPQCY